MSLCINQWDGCTNDTDHPSQLCEVCRAGDHERDRQYDEAKARGAKGRLKLVDEREGVA